MRKFLLGTAAVIVAVGVSSAAEAAGYKIGISNTVQGNVGAKKWSAP